TCVKGIHMENASANKSETPALRCWRLACSCQERNGVRSVESQGRLAGGRGAATQRLLVVRLDVVGGDRATRRRHLTLVRRQRAVHPARPEMARRRGAVHHQDRLPHPGRAQLPGHPCHVLLQCVLLAATSRCSVWPGMVAIASSAASARKLIQRAIRSLIL